MKDSLITPGYTLFLEFVEEHELGIELDPSLLSYKWDPHKKLLSVEWIRYKSYLHPLRTTYKTFSSEETEIKEVLRVFLIELLSNPGNFMGYPTYEASKYFTNEEYRFIMNEALEIINAREKRKRELYENAPIVHRLAELKLHPEPTEGEPHKWKANCISGRPHHMSVDLKNEICFCGYCKFNGDVEKLAEDWKRK